MHPNVLRELSIIWSLFHTLVLFVLLYRSRFSNRKTFVLTILTMFPVIGVNVWGLIYFGPAQMGRIFLLTCTLPSIIFFYYMSVDRRGRFLFTFCFSDTMAYWVIVITNLTEFYFGDGRCILMFLGRLILFPLIEWWAYKVLRRPYLELQSSVNKGWGVFAGMSAVYYLLLAIMANYPSLITDRPQEMPAFLLILVLMPLNYATIFTAMYRQFLLYRKEKSETVLREVNQQMQAQLENQKRIYRMKHDMRAHTITLSGLLSQDKVDEARTYLEKLISTQKVYEERFCANPYLNAVLSRYVMKFEELGISFRLDIRTGEEKLPHMELCQIISNGLENACNCVSQLETDSDREVSIQMQYHKNWLVIRMKNRCQKGLRVEKGEIPKTDQFGREHGFGLQTIQEAAKSLGGDMFCYTENGFFVLDIMVRGGNTVCLE